jgi:hypothetical protein
MTSAKKAVVSLLESRLLLVISIVYLVFSCLFLSSPGLQYDEVLFANASLGNLDNSFIAYQWRIGSVDIPLMLMPYIGAIKAFVGNHPPE